MMPSDRSYRDELKFSLGDFLAWSMVAPSTCVSANLWSGQ